MINSEAIILITIFATLLGFLFGWFAGAKLAYDRLYTEEKLKEKNT
jgi:hypothetical protein